MLDYFFKGSEYICVQREDVGPGVMLPSYPRPISDWGWGSFGATGIDAALYSGCKCYFFKGKQYIRVTRGQTDLGTVDPDYPRSISDWNWPANFAPTGIDCALWSGSVCYFFNRTKYLRVTRGDTGAGTIDPGYPKDIGQGWRFSGFGAGGTKGTNGMDAALYSGPKTYFFSGKKYIQVSKADQESDIIDGFAFRDISDWGWGSFGADGIDAALYSGGPLAPIPSGGLRSDYNYFLHANGQTLTDVTVTLAVDDTLDSTTHGWAVQVNCYSKKAAEFTSTTTTRTTTSEWQQYVLYAAPDSGDVHAFVDSWQDLHEPSGQAVSSGTGTLLATMPRPTLAIGSSLSFSLHTDPTSGSPVTGCTYTITYEGDASSQSFFPMLSAPVTKTATLHLMDMRDESGRAATRADLAPIVALQVNIVGNVDGANAPFERGAGTITYTAAQALVASATEPAFTTFHGVTAETSNMGYGPLPAADMPAPPTQSFQLVPGSSGGLAPASGLRHGKRLPFRPARFQATKTDQGTKTKTETKDLPVRERESAT